MPKELTHWILAQTAADELGSGNRLAGIIRTHPSTYLAGAVLPDTLLHLFFGRDSATALRLADRFHDATGNSFDPLIRAESRCAGGLPDDLLACLLGVITHMLGDIVCHPFVYAVGGTRDIGRHYLVETAIDVHFLRKGFTPPVRRVDELITPETRRTLLRAMALLFDPQDELPVQALERALALHRRFQSMYDRTGWKIAAKILARLCGSPFREQQHLFYPLKAASDRYSEDIGNIAEWNHPVTGDIRRASIGDLVGEARKRIVEIFGRIEELGSLSPALTEHPGHNLLTGLSGVGKAEMK